MKRFKNILLVHEPTSRGRKALGRAVDLATRNDARLTLLEIVAELPGDGEAVRLAGGEVDLRELVTRERTAALEAVAAPLAADGVRVETRLAFDTPFLAVLQAVADEAHDLVVLTAEGGGAREHLFGSTSRHLLRKCPCPVWVVQPVRRRRRFRVLAAVNPVADDEVGADLDRRIMEMASSLARMYDGRLDVVHVWHSAPRSTRIQRHVIERWNVEARLAAEERVAALLRNHDLADLAPRVHVPGGPPGLRIAETAAAVRADIVVMGTLSRSGLAGLFIGNTCETVLQHLDASVLAVKPRGFRSPVTFRKSANRRQAVRG